MSGELPFFWRRAWGHGLWPGDRVVGIALGMAITHLRWLDWALDLPINALYAMPLVAVDPAGLWFGIYLKAKIIVVFLFAVFPLLINTYQGVRECDKAAGGRAFVPFEQWRTWQDVLLPFALPYIFAGIRLAISRQADRHDHRDSTPRFRARLHDHKYANVFAMDGLRAGDRADGARVALTTLLKWAGRRIALESWQPLSGGLPRLIAMRNKKPPLPAAFCNGYVVATINAAGSRC